MATLKTHNILFDLSYIWFRQKISVTEISHKVYKKLSKTVMTARQIVIQHFTTYRDIMLRANCTHNMMVHQHVTLHRHLSGQLTSVSPGYQTLCKVG